MDPIDLALSEAWSRLAPALRADRIEAARRASRRIRALLTRPVRPWCLCIRASDTRISPATVLHDGEATYYARLPHRITLDADDIRRLCAPVHIPWPGLTVQQAADRLGQTPANLYHWIRRGVFNEIARRRPNGRVEGPPPLIWSPSPLDPSSPAGRGPDPIWGTLWQSMASRIPDGFSVTVQRIPRERRASAERPSRRAFCGWHFICPGLSPDAPCGRRVSKLFIPLRPFSLLDFLGNPIAAELPQDADTRDLPLAARLPLPPIPTPPLAAACLRCHNVLQVSLVSPGGWNQFVACLSGGLLYGHEVRMPEGIVVRRRNPCRRPRKHTPRRDEILRLITEGLSNKEIAARLGLSWKGVQAQVQKLFRHYGVRGRRGLYEMLYGEGRLARSDATDRRPGAGSPDAPALHGYRPHARAWGATVFRPPGLSRAKREILEMLLRGMTVREIAAERGVTPNAVYCRIQRIYRHYGVHSRAELFARLGREYRRPAPSVRAKIVRALQRDLKLREIAAEVGVSYGTVCNHCAVLWREYGVSGTRALRERLKAGVA